jgi:hypothetical protein
MMLILHLAYTISEKDWVKVSVTVGIIAYHYVMSITKATMGFIQGSRPGWKSMAQNTNC